MLRRFEVLDIFRGIFAFIIVVYHVRSFADSPIINNSFMDNGDVFVDFFFVLSGFVITYNNETLTENNLNGFLKKRFLRVYPLHLILLVAFVFIESFKNLLGDYIHINQPYQQNDTIYSFLSNLFLLNSVKFFDISGLSWNLPSWAISAEMISWLVFGISVVILNKTGILKQKTFYYIIITGISLISLVLLTHSSKLIYTYDYGFLRCLIGFFTGAVCYHAYNRLIGSFNTWSVTIFNLLEISIAGVMFLLVFYGEFFRSYGYVFEMLFFFTILIFSAEKGILSRLLKKSGLLKRTGMFSYSIYMIHALILSIFDVVFIRIFKFPATSYSYLIFLYFFIVYKASQWTYWNIEKTIPALIDPLAAKAPTTAGRA